MVEILGQLLGQRVKVNAVSQTLDFRSSELTVVLVSRVNEKGPIGRPSRRDDPGGWLTFDSGLPEPALKQIRDAEANMNPTRKRPRR